MSALSVMPTADPLPSVEGGSIPASRHAEEAMNPPG